MKRIAALILVIFSIAMANAQRVTDQFDRGVVAINKGNNQVFISWRFLATDPDDIAFNIYRQVGSAEAVKLNTNPITGATNFLWNVTGTSLGTASRFFVKPLINGVEGVEDGAWQLKANAPANRIVRDFNYAALPAGYPKMMMKFCWVGDLDGDRKFDFVIDRHGAGMIEDEEESSSTTGTAVSSLVEAYTSEGAFLWRINMGNNVKISNGHNDMVTVFDMDGNGKAEVLMAVSEGTTFADGTQIKNTDGTVHDYSTVAGSAPQWLAIVDGETGNLIHKVELPHFNNIATTRTDRWKDISGHFIIQYLDGIHPSIVYQYKNRQASGNFTGAYAAWRYLNGQLVNQWGSLIQKNDVQYEAHQVRAADVDGDGRDELVEISYAVDDDGSFMYYAPNVAHGDRHTLADIDPDRPGLEQFFIQQTNIMGMGMFDAATGEIIKGLYMPAVSDVGRGICAAFSPNVRGMQFWSTMNGYQMYDRNGKEITGAAGDFPAEALWWGPGLSRYMASPIGDGGFNIAFQKYNPSTKRMERDLPNFYNEGSPYYLKSFGAGRAAFWGDILGDWREEMVLPRRDSTGFAVVSNWETTTHRQYCLMQNPAYRLQTTARGYYQTADVDFYMAADMPKPPVAPVQKADVYFTSGNALTAAIADGKTVMLDIRQPNADIQLNENIEPTRLWLMNPKGKNHTISGTGKITGEGDIVKSMQGDIILNGTHDFSGKLRISEGRMFINGSIAAPVQLDARGVIGGNASLNGGISLEKGLNIEGGRIEPGMPLQTGTLTIAGNLSLPGRNNLAFEVDQTKTQKSDLLEIQGNFNVTGNENSIILNPLTAIKSGGLTLITFTGTTNATKANFMVKGLEGVPFELLIEPNAIRIEMSEPREAGSVVWKGSKSGVWDLQTRNFLNGSTEDIFVPGDSVLFNDNATLKTITISETLPVSDLVFQNNTDYRISGTGIISGSGGLTKTGTGKLSLLNEGSTFSGKVDFSEGILEVSSLKDGGLPSSIGASGAAASNWTMRNATLQTASQLATNRNMTVVGKLTVNNPASNHSVMISGNISGENIALELTGAGSLNLQGTNNFKTVLVKSGTLALGSVDANRTALGTAHITLEGGTLQMRDANSTGTVGPFINTIDVPEGKTANWNLPKRWNFTNKLTGKGRININIPYVRSEFIGDWSAFEGTIAITGSSGEFRINNAFGYAKATFNLGSIGNLYHLSTGQTVRLGALTGIAGSKLSGGSTHWIVGANNADNLTFAGEISGTSSKLTKEGTGKLTLSSANLYTGSTDVTKGTLWIANTAGSGTGTGAITVRADARFGGTGIVSGGINLYANSTLLLQNNSINTFTTAGSVNLMANALLSVDVNAGTATSDVLKVGGSISVNGDLHLNNQGTKAFADGDEFKILNVTGTIAGAFATITPELPEGLSWDQSKLVSDGIIAVKAITSVSQINIGKEVESTEHFSFTGASIPADSKGFVIRKTTYTDGSVGMEKLFKQ